MRGAVLVIGERRENPGMLMRVWRVVPMAAGLVLASRVLTFPPELHHDCAMYLQAGQMLLAGAIPYIDVIDINPPLIMYLNVIPAWLARFTGITPIPAFRLCVLALIGWSVWRSQTELRRAWAPGAAALMATAWVGFSLMVWSGGVFGQREHLFMLVYVPFLLARWRRWSGQSLSRGSVALALPAAVGVCLKPHLVLILLAPELFALARTRRWRNLLAPEVLLLALPPLLYAAHLLILPAAARHALLDRWVPWVGHWYALYNVPWTVLLKPHLWICLAVGGALLVYASWPGARGDFERLTGMLAAGSLAAAAAFLLQQKGWGYHSIPMAGFTVLLLAGLVARVLMTPRTTLVTAFAVCAAVGIIPYSWYASQTALRGLSTRILIASYAPVLKRFAHENEPVLVLSTSVTPAYPLLVEMNWLPGSRYLWTFPFASIANNLKGQDSGEPVYPTAEQLRPDERQLLDEIAADIRTRRPAAIMIQNEEYSQACPVRFKMLAYLTQAGWVSQALGDYKLVGAFPSFEVFARNDRVVSE